MDPVEIEAGLRVKTVEGLIDSRGMDVSERYINSRAPSKVGVVSGNVPGCGRDLWFVHHKDGSVGAYTFDEFGPLPSWKDVFNANHGSWGSLAAALETAERARYPMIYWSGAVYAIKKEGSINMNEQVCLAEDLD